MKQKTLIAYTELSLAMIITGSSVVVGKLIIADFPVLLASGLSLLIALLTIIPIQYIAKKGIPKPTKVDFFYLILQALFGLFIFRIFMLYALDFTGAVEAGIITSTTPAWIALIAFIILKEKIGFSKGLGIFLSVLGIILINIFSSSNGITLNLMHIIGNLLVVGAVIGEALFTIFRKPISPKIDALSGTTYVILFGFLMFLPLAMYEAINFQFSALTLASWLAIVYYGTIVTVLSFILWFSGVLKVEATTAGVFTALMPISAIILANLILGEKIYWFHGLGTVLVLAGILLSINIFSRKKRKNNSI